MKLGQNGIVSLLIRLAAFQASGAACMKLHKIRCRSKKYLTAEIAEYAEIIQFFFSAFSAISAVNSYVSFLIRLAAFQASGAACMKLNYANMRFRPPGTIISSFFLDQTGHLQPATAFESRGSCLNRD